MKKFTSFYANKILEGNRRFVCFRHFSISFQYFHLCRRGTDGVKLPIATNVDQILWPASHFLCQPHFSSALLFFKKAGGLHFILITALGRAGLSPSSGRWQSNQWWQTTCGPWYHWLRSWGCQSAWSGPPAVNFSTDPSGLSWSGRESEPAEQ